MGLLDTVRRLMAQKAQQPPAAASMTTMAADPGDPNIDPLTGYWIKKGKSVVDNPELHPPTNQKSSAGVGLAEPLKRDAQGKGVSMARPGGRVSL